MSVELIGQTLAGRYHLESLLGQGGMGTVYAAVDLHLGREVAVKTIREEFLPNASVVSDFTREAKIIAQLACNPHILTIYDLGSTGAGDPFIVAERLRGRTLKALIREQASPSRSWVLEVGIQVALALADVHAQGVVHRDLKPGNIFVVKTSAIPLLAKVIDFGISRSPQHAADRYGEASGTPDYMSPEVAAGQFSSPASDIYSLGITLYELATGVHPYPSGSAAEAMAAAQTVAVTEGPLVESRFPKTFRQLILAMTDKDYRCRPSPGDCLKRLWEANREIDESKRHAELSAATDTGRTTASRA